jgi:3-hydroxyacyl-CoA dehydrogenase
MQSKQQFARVAAGRLVRKTGHGIYDYDEREAIRLLSPS